MNKTTFKSIGAVLAGFFTIVILSIVTDLILEKIKFFPPPEQGIYNPLLLIIALAYRCIYTILGGYITGKLAPRNIMRHVTILGIIGTAISIVGVFVGWNLSAHWYPISLVITALPCCWLGGKLVIKQPKQVSYGSI